MKIELASNETDIKRCCAVLRQLRPHLEEDAIMRQIVRQQAAGYLLAYCESEKVIRSVAGYRYGENLAYGKYMYVDDLVTNHQDRSKGFGKLLFDWLVAAAKEQGCEVSHWIRGFNGLVHIDFTLPIGWTLSLITSVCASKSETEVNKGSFEQKRAKVTKTKRTFAGLALKNQSASQHFSRPREKCAQMPTFVGARASRERIRPGEPLPRRLVAGDLFTNCKICGKVRLALEFEFFVPFVFSV
jgi:hypothetical protein